MTRPTAAILLIGNELLSGKIADRNAAYLTRRLHGLGVQVCRIVVIPDEVELIADEVRTLSSSMDLLFTSGGIGPTHDDLTIDGVARGLGLEVIQPAHLVEALRDHFKDRLTEAHLRMARVPERHELIYGESLRWPVLRSDNVYVLPGVPEIFRMMVEIIAPRFRSTPVVLRCAYLDADEGAVAEALEALETRFEVAVGSYPRVDRDADHRIRVTVESEHPEAVDAAMGHLETLLERSLFVRVDPPLADR